MENKRLRARLQAISEMAAEAFYIDRDAMTPKNGRLGLVEPDIYELPA